MKSIIHLLVSGLILLICGLASAQTIERNFGASAGGSTGSNPTGTVGLTAVNGVALTFLRSDGAPALSQAIVPTWTGIHTWSLAEPRLLLSESDQGADLKTWDFDLNAGVLSCRTRTDADGAGKNWCAVTRGATTAITDVSFGNATDNPTFNVLGTGGVTVGGLFSAPRINVSGASAPSVGIYRPAANTLGLASNSALRLSADANGLIIVATGIGQGGGLKHQRVTTGAITTGATAVVTLTWTAGFADANYTVTCDVEDATAAVASLLVNHIESKVAASTGVRVQNTSAGTLTGTLDCIAMHD